MRHAFSGLLVLALAGCGSPPPPIVDGTTMTWNIAVAGKPPSLLRMEFAEVGSGWQLTTQAGPPGELKPPERRFVDAHLADDDGKRFSVFTFPVWLPPDARADGASFEDMRIAGTTSWMAWTAWHATVGPANGYYDADTGYLVGVSVPRLGGLSATLTETNVPGLAVASP